MTRLLSGHESHYTSFHKHFFATFLLKIVPDNGVAKSLGAFFMWMLIMVKTERCP